MFGMVYMYSILHWQNTFCVRPWTDLQAWIIKTGNTILWWRQTYPYFFLYIYTLIHTEIHNHTQKVLHMHPRKHWMDKWNSSLRNIKWIHYATSNEYLIIYKIIVYIHVCSVKLLHMHNYIKLSVYTHPWQTLIHALTDLCMQENSFLSYSGTSYSSTACLVPLQNLYQLFQRRCIWHHRCKKIPMNSRYT